MSSDLERLETKLAFLERANSELSDVVYRQQRELDELRTRVAGLVQQLDAQKQESQPYPIVDERPPHY
jgi:uncharacterized coiled-coil protein SlyX